MIDRINQITDTYKFEIDRLRRAVENLTLEKKKIFEEIENSIERNMTSFPKKLEESNFYKDYLKIKEKHKK